MPHFNVPYLVGNKFGRDYPFWPTIALSEVAPPGDDAARRAFELGFPLALNETQIECLMWRTREWTVAASSWTASLPAFDTPIVSQDDIAVLNASGDTPEFTFIEQRYDVIGNSAFRAVTDERDRLANWENFPLAKDSHFFPTPPRTTTLWKTLRNLGVGHLSSSWPPGAPPWTVDSDPNWNGYADPSSISYSYFFTEPYNHVKFGEGGSGITGILRFLILAGYTVFDPDTKLFYPPFQLSSILPFTFGPGGRAGTAFSLYPTTTPPPPPPGGFESVICGTFTLVLPADAGTVTCRIATDAYQSGNPPPGSIPGLIIPSITGAFDLTMTATKFWQYRNKLDQPVWDENDGHQLHDPLA